MFFDKVFPLLRFADVIERPVIYGKTPARKRNEIIGRFKAGTIKVRGPPRWPEPRRR